MTGHRSLAEGYAKEFVSPVLNGAVRKSASWYADWNGDDLRVFGSNSMVSLMATILIAENFFHGGVRFLEAKVSHQMSRRALPQRATLSGGSSGP